MRSFHEQHPDTIYTYSPSKTLGWPTRRACLGIATLLTAAAVGGLAAYGRSHRQSSNDRMENKGGQTPPQGGCQAQYTIPLWSEGKVPFARPGLDQPGQAPYMIAYVPQGKHAHPYKLPTALHHT